MRKRPPDPSGGAFIFFEEPLRRNREVPCELRFPHPSLLLVGKLLSHFGMRHDFAFVIPFLLVLGGAARAGDPIVPRKQFKEAAGYPYVFKPESYIASRGPLPMRFAGAGPSCEARRPPAPPVIAKSEAVNEPRNADPKAPSEPQPEPVAPSAPASEPTPKREGPDFSKVPDEVLDFFKNTEGRPVRRAYLFDPIFQPVTPDELPKSKATSQQK